MSVSIIADTLTLSHFENGHNVTMYFLWGRAETYIASNLRACIRTGHNAGVCRRMASTLKMEQKFILSTDEKGGCNIFWGNPRCCKNGVMLKIKPNPLGTFPPILLVLQMHTFVINQLEMLVDRH